MDIKKNLRKMILQEIYGKILLEQDATAKDVTDNARSAVKAAKPAPKAAAPAKPKNDGRFVSSEAAQAAKDMLLKNAELFGKGVEAPTNGISLSKDQAIKLADELYEATESWTPSVSGLMSGKIGAAGTDEEAILKALKEIPTLADLSYVAYHYSNGHKDYELAETLEEEYGTFTSDEFYKVRMAIEDIYERGLFVLAGEVITIKKMEEIASIAAKNKGALEKAQGKPAEGGGSFDISGLAAAPAAMGVGVGAAAGTGAALGAVAGAAGAGSGAAFSAINALGAGAVAASAKVGTSAAALGLGGTAAGAVGGTAAVLTAVPVGGWIALGVLALGVGLWAAFDNEDFSEQELKMLSPDFYIGLKKMFPELSENFKKAAADIDPSLYPSESEGQEDVAESEESSDLGWGLEQPYVLNIIKTMNAYAAKKSLEGYTPPPEENKWSPVVQEAWLKFAPHALANCGLYSQFKISNVDNWKNMSAAMKSKYPGYTPNPRGCLAFCLDAYYCELRYGNEAPSSGGSGRGSGGGGGGGGSGGGDAKKEVETKGSSKKITVELNQTGKNFKNSGFSLSSGRDPDELMIKAILNEMSAQSVRAGYPGGQVTFFFVLDKNNKIVDVQNELGGGQNAGLNLPLKNIRNALEDIAKGLIFPTSGSYSKDGGTFDNPKRLRRKSIKVTFEIPAGNVKDLQP